MAERLWRVSPSSRRPFSEVTVVPTSPLAMPFTLLANYLVWNVLSTLTAILRSPAPLTFTATMGMGKLRTAHTGSTQNYQQGIDPSGTNAAYFT